MNTTNNTDNIFAQAINQALDQALNQTIKRAVEMAVEPLHLQIDVLKTEIQQLRANQTDTAAYADRVDTEINVDRLVDTLDRKEWFWAKIQSFVVSYTEDIDFEDEVSNVLNNMDLSDYIDTDDLASTVADQFDIDDKLREAINGLEVTINLR